MKDLPQTNYSLLKLQQMLKANNQGMNKVDKLKSLNFDNALLKVEEQINREHNPKLLILHGIFGSELIYKEEAELFNKENAGSRFYSFSKKSILRNYFGY
mmetsp:Transcript_21851/g.25124  ORF Transcript_21851/g.25124 Transcript_21851/m.25124 type:complete len:100 (+) Transcript_21851:158-457(+)